ncbi:imidazolonepropionase [Kangiella geojedonensis]|uniref:Imidazolonepropionase n=1 Tax=Kangiella geojedonensis TaxID=914150 RepID=A0A0F6TQ50_9GAMM|nr:imidazolonepropionase [Kangiella geojedonensis]AKE51889.1 imidazolonepropionase [Kangiella geojedonensis]
MSQSETKPFDYIIHNVNIATLSDQYASEDNPYGVIENGAIGVNDGLISYVGDSFDKNDSKLNATETIDAQAQWLSPGLIDCHTHLVYGGNRANEFEMRLNGVAYEEIAKAGGGIISSVEATREATEEELFRSAAKRLQSFIDEGVTTIEIKSGYGLDTENEIKMLKVAKRLEQEFPIRVSTTFLGAHALPPEFKDNSDGYIDLVCNDMIPKIAELGLADCVDAFCESIGFSYTQTERVFKAAQKHGLKVKLHAEQLSDQSGAGLAADYKALSADHLEYLSQDSIDKMAKSGTVAVLLPGAFYFLRETKLPPMDELRQAGVPIAVASDSNPGTSPAQSLLLMLNMACTLFRMTPLEALQGVTINAAKALGLEDKVGSIEIGKKAELALWDIDHPNQLSYQLGGNNLVKVYNSINKK